MLYGKVPFSCSRAGGMTSGTTCNDPLLLKQVCPSWVCMLTD